MKRKLLLLSVLVICVAIAAVGTLAFFNTKAVAHNVITTGGVNIELHEYADEACKTDYNTNKTGIMPGMTVDKYARIALAEGSADAWVRVKFEKKITFAAGNEHAQGKTPDLDLVELTMPEGWIAGNDGWYYLEAPLTSNTPVFALNSVTFDVAMGNEYQGATATVDIVAEAVQKANSGDTIKDDIFWPASGTGVVSGVTG